eukprot:scaffold320623_cov59-Attheya_sp.AAC.3
MLTNKKTGILWKFNDVCENAIHQSVVTFEDFSKLVLSINSIDAYVQTVNTKAPALFEIFATLWNIEYTWKAKANLIPLQERQAFFQIVSMFNQ